MKKQMRVPLTTLLHSEDSTCDVYKCLNSDFTAVEKGKKTIKEKEQRHAYRVWSLYH
ncbi:hypothetical protein YC2023_088485 [Brassica napus]